MMLAPFCIPRHPLLFGAYALPLAAPAALLAQTLSARIRRRRLCRHGGPSILPLEGLSYHRGRAAADYAGAERGLAGAKAARRPSPTRWCATCKPWAATWSVDGSGRSGGVAPGRALSLRHRPGSACGSPATACRPAIAASLRFRNPGVFKVDWALDGPIPWTAEACHHSATVHRRNAGRSPRRASGLGGELPASFRPAGAAEPLRCGRAPAASKRPGPTAHVPNGSTWT